MSFNAGSIVSTLGIDTSPFSQGMLQATSIAQIFPSTVTNFLANPLLGIIGLAKDAAGAITNAFLSVARAADNAGESAQKAGVSVEFLTGIGAAFKDAGSSVEGLGDALKFLNKNAAEAASGNKTAADAFAKLGISASFVQENLGNTEGLFFAVADGIAGLGTTAQKTEASMGLLGRGGADAIAALSGGSSGLQSFAADVAKLGGVTSTSLAEAGDAFGHLETFIDAGIEGLKQAVAQPILQVLVDHFGSAKEGMFSIFGALRTFITDTMGGILSFVMENAESFGHIFSGIGEIVTGILPLLGSLAQLVGSVLGPVFKIVSPIIHLFGAMIGWVADKVSFLVGWVAKAIGAVTTFIGLGSDVEDKPQRKSKSVNDTLSSIADSSLNDGKNSTAIGASKTGAASSEFNSLKSALSSTAQLTTGPFSSGVSTATDALGELRTTFKDLAETAQAFKKVLDDIAHIASSEVGNRVAAVASGAAFNAPVQDGGAGAGGGTTEIKQMNVNVPAFDVAAASSAIAEKILPVLRVEFAAQVNQMQAAARSDRVMQGL